MQTLQLLGVALGMATLAGLNLYLTVFVTGLAIQQHWIQLAPVYAPLEVLGNPVIVLVAGVLYFIEFFADKIPWVDSLWDAFHTVIRPIGAAFVAVTVLGEPNAVFDVIIALMAGSTALVVHSVKTGTRLVANASPEPFSNIALSLGEDAVVLAGLGLIHWSPIVALGTFGFALSLAIYLLPKLCRAAFAVLWLAWKKLRLPAKQTQGLSKELCFHADRLFSRLNVLNEKIAWALPCLSGSAPKIPKNIFGYLVATESTPNELHFVARRGRAHQTFDLTGYKVSYEPGFLSESIVFSRTDKGSKHVFVTDRGSKQLAEAAVAEMRMRLDQAFSEPSQ